MSTYSAAATKVARLDLGVFFAFIGVPLYALAKVEGIYSAVVGNIPAFGKAGLHNAVAVKFHKAVYAQRAEHGNIGCGALQIVQRAYLRGIHLSIGSVYLFGVLRGGVGFGIGLRGVVIPLRGATVLFGLGSVAPWQPNMAKTIMTASNRAANFLYIVILLLLVSV